MIECWSCKVPMSLSERVDCDGCCPGCGAEVDLEDYLCRALSERDQLRAEVEALRKDRDIAISAFSIGLEEWSKLRKDSDYDLEALFSPGSGNKARRRAWPG